MSVAHPLHQSSLESNEPIAIEDNTNDDSLKKKHRRRIDKYFKAAVKMEASDIHFKADCPPRFRVSGVLRNAKSEPLGNEEIVEMVGEILSPAQKEHYEQKGSVDIAYALTDEDRFRLNVFRQRGLMSLAARRIAKQILGYEQLHLPESIGKLANSHQGLVLLSGITGSGKSTTIATMLEQINLTRACHIVTLEDPIEFLFKDKKAFINQREIGIDVQSYEDGLKYLMREDPDVVLIGEMRDAETFAAAIQAAESGHLVFATVHASGTAQTLTRILELFPDEARNMVRSSLAFNLQGIICQKLIPSTRKDISRIPAVEIMIVNPSIRKLIEEGREHDIKTVLRSSYNEGMIDMTEYIRRLVEADLVSYQVALQSTPNPDELRMKLKGIEVGSGGLIG